MNKYPFEHKYYIEYVTIYLAEIKMQLKYVTQCKDHTHKGNEAEKSEERNNSDKEKWRPTPVRYMTSIIALKKKLITTVTGNKSQTEKALDWALKIHGYLKWF